MSDVQWLFVVLAALYGWECLCWLQQGAVALVTWRGRRWALRHPGALAGNQRGGFILAPPLPPLGTVFVAGQCPVSLSPEGVLAFVATNLHPGWRPAQSGQFVPWDELRGVKTRGKKLLVNGTPFLVAASPGAARLWRHRFQQLANEPAARRGQSIAEILKQTFDTKLAAAHCEAFRKEAHAVRWFANLLLGYVFVVVPVAIWGLGFKLAWLWLLLGLLTLTVTTATQFARAHRRLHPEAGDERFTHTLTIALAPASAMRAHDALSRPLLEAFHPLAAANVLLPAASFRALARRALRDVRQPALPTCPNPQAAAVATELFFRAALRTTMEAFLKTHGIEPDELCRAPEPAEAASRAYCPRCETQFATAAARCADCGGLALVAF
jgi:hypothetical protein